MVYVVVALVSVFVGIVMATWGLREAFEKVKHKIWLNKAR